MKKRGRKKNEKKNFTHFTYTERLQIEELLKAGTPVDTIAELLHKDRSSIYREIKRGGYDGLNGSDYSMYRAYSPDIAEAKYRENMKAKGAPLKIDSDSEYAEYIENKIVNEKYSPRAVLGEIKQKGLKFNTTISYTTLYRYIDEGVFLHLTNQQNLPVKRSETKHQYRKVIVVRPTKGESIENRTEAVYDQNGKLCMNKVHVTASRSYDVLVGGGLLDKAGEYIADAVRSRHVCVVTDDNVDGLYSARLLDSLTKCGFTAEKFVFPHGEASKSHKTLLALYDFLAEHSFTRSDALIALGGGVTGDLTGFAAASYMRGIGFVQIPTTILAQTDSSVGGKTAVDIAGGKNLVGAFYQPQIVLCDTETLSTLSPEFFADGMAEVVKYGMIKSRELFELLAEKDVRENLEDIITQCVSIKAKVVENDERDTGERMVLNFGHTLGHAIEKYYNYNDISHGYAVAIGMSTFTHIAEEKGMCAEGISARLDGLLRKFGLPLTTEVPVNKLFEYSLGDKKRDSSGINIVLCPEIGKSGGYPMSIDEYREFLGAGYPGSVDSWK